MRKPAKQDSQSQGTRRLGCPAGRSRLPGWDLPSWTTYRYEGSRPISRGVLPGSGSSPAVTTTWEFDTLGYVKKILAKYGASTRLDLGVDRDLEGNVLALHYAKVSGKSGDRFQLDGFDRLKDACLGVDDFNGTYPPSVHDKRITYALDAAHNRDHVTVEGQGPTNYERNPGTNEYQSVGGIAYTYDGNGNLACDGWLVYRYDLHDRLSEVYVITYPAGASGGTLAGRAVYGPEIQLARQGKPTKLSLKEIRYLVARAREKLARDLKAKKFSLKGGVGTSTAKSSGVAPEGPDLVLVAWYGYDPWNRRVTKMLPEETKWYTYDGWQNVDEYDGGFQPQTVHFDGPGIDEHLAYARLEGSTWRRYTLVQGHLGSVMKVLDENGNVVERYEYDPYGRRYIYDAGGTSRSQTAVGNPYGFTGRRHDPETGLLYYRNRYYSPHIGRFLTYDPIGIWKDVCQWGNGFSPLGGKPSFSADPDGNFFGLFAIVTVAAISGVIAWLKTGSTKKAITVAAVSAGMMLGAWAFVEVFEWVAVSMSGEALGAGAKLVSGLTGLQIGNAIGGKIVTGKGPNLGSMAKTECVGILSYGFEKIVGMEGAGGGNVCERFENDMVKSAIMKPVDAGIEKGLDSVVEAIGGEPAEDSIGSPKDEGQDLLKGGNLIPRRKNR